MRGKAQRVACRTLHYWTKVHQIFTRLRGVIGGVNARASILQASYLPRNASAQNEGGVCQFSPIDVKKVG